MVAHVGQVKALSAQLGGVPWLVVGDFNSPSNLDWTPAVVAKRGLRYAVNWPLGATLNLLGTRDVFREVHPDPVAVPGFTWSPWGPEDEPPQLEVPDRVDWILSGPSGVTASAAAVVGPKGDGVAGFWPWPSDHWGVVASLQVDLMSGVKLALGRARLLKGAPLPVFFGGKNPVTIDGGPQQLTLQPGWNDVSMSGVSVGSHTLREAGGVQCTFWIATDGPAKITLLEDQVPSGEAITVTIENGPGMMLDYLAVYACEGGSVDAPQVYSYTGATVFGTASIAPPFFMEGNNPAWPLLPGCYIVSLLRDDDPTAQAAPPIRVTIGEARSWTIAVVLAPVAVLMLMIGAGLLLLVVYRKRRAREYEHV